MLQLDGLAPQVPQRQALTLDASPGLRVARVGAQAGQRYQADLNSALVHEGMNMDVFCELDPGAELTSPARKFSFSSKNPSLKSPSSGAKKREKKSV